MARDTYSFIMNTRQLPLGRHCNTQNLESSRAVFSHGGDTRHGNSPRLKLPPYPIPRHSRSHRVETRKRQVVENATKIHNIFTVERDHDDSLTCHVLAGRDEFDRRVFHLRSSHRVAEGLRHRIPAEIVRHCKHTAKSRERQKGMI